MAQFFLTYWTVICWGLVSLYWLFLCSTVWAFWWQSFLKGDLKNIFYIVETPYDRSSLPNSYWSVSYFFLLRFLLCRGKDLIQASGFKSWIVTYTMWSQGSYFLSVSPGFLIWKQRVWTVLIYRSSLLLILYDSSCSFTMKSLLRKWKAFCLDFPPYF